MCIVTRVTMPVWRSKSYLMKAATAIMAVSLIGGIFVVVSRHWATPDGDHLYGIWTYVLDPYIQVPDAAMPIVYPVFGIMVNIMQFCSLVLNIMFLHRNSMLVLPALVTFSLMQGAMMSVLLILWAIPHGAHGFALLHAFYIALGVAALQLVAGALCGWEFYRCRHYILERERVAAMPDTGESTDLSAML